VEAAYLCGRDGARSAVRQGLGLGLPGGTYDQVFYVADVDADDLAVTRFNTVAIAPNVSARAIAAPPWSTAGLVQRSGRTTRCATTFSGDALTISMPSKVAKGSGSIATIIVI
jgi:2-polyprenyl-6-methoxyphenol hydroxylase-like FAD-dependent oxidoreductase